jgi:peptide/nickel transport system substrate-binding protein
MDREARRQFELFRRGAGPIENQAIDDLLEGEFYDRQEFLRRGTMFGLSLSVLSAALVAAGEAPVAFAKATAPRAGARLKVGISPVPAGTIEPFSQLGSGVFLASIAGEYLVRSTINGLVRPELAVSWKPNAHATVWTVKLRQNVKFQSGQTLSAQDVIATFKRLTDPKGQSQALSVFGGVLVPDGVRPGPTADSVAFHLERPTASFPLAISPSTFSAIILPANYQPGTFVSQPQATGAFEFASYTPGVGATLNRYAGWWRGRPPLDGVDATFYADSAAVDAALLTGGIDLTTSTAPTTDRPLYRNPKIEIFRAPSSDHAQVCMRVDRPPFSDYRVRQAIALCLDRPAAVKTLLDKYGQVGNDTPFAPIYPSTVRIPQRHKNIKLAKELLAAAGHPHGFSAQITVGNYGAGVQYAQIIQAAVKEIGIRLTVKTEPLTVYYAGKPAVTPWLNDPMTITPWLSRPTPDTFLTAALQSKGIWNASHYKNRRFDTLSNAFVAAVARKDQRKYARQMETVLQHDTPVIWAWFSDDTTAGSTKVRGYHVLPNNFYMSDVSLRT